MTVETKSLAHQLYQLIAYLKEENSDSAAQFSSYPKETVEEKFELYRAFANVREPQALSEDFLKTESRVLSALTKQKNLTSIDDLKPLQPQLYLWEGDITTLEVDAIVNAANSEFIGCRIPNHNCIDNAIHTWSGVELRLACHNIIERQGNNEPVGKAKITPAFNLPSKHVIHTVGPYVDTRGVTAMRKELLASSYRESLKVADAHNLDSIAFCCISTGEFNFPNDQAAEVAIQTVQKYIKETGSNINVIFNTFKPQDTEIYQEKLSKAPEEAPTKQTNQAPTKEWQALKNQNNQPQAEQLHQLIEEADAVVVGIGAGMSAAAGFTYVGPRFDDNFPDFIEKFGFFDMLQAFVSHIPDWQEYWAFNSRFTLLNYFDQPVGQEYLELKEILKDKEYHVITTNADNAFYAAEYDRDQVFYCQGEYGLWQCENFCHQETYQDEALIRQMVEEQENMKVPEELIPMCPKCGAHLEVNKRDAVKGMVEDAYWHEQENRYHTFLEEHQGEKVLFLEIGVGNTTPQFIRDPFQEWTGENSNAVYVMMNQKPYRIPREIQGRSVRINEDISEVISTIVSKGA